MRSRSWCVSMFLLSVVAAVGCGSQARNPIEADVVYGHKDGMALTFDVFLADQPNGAAVLFMVSGGWYSRWAEPEAMLPVCQPMLDAGFTVFVVRHGSAPKYTVPEAVDDVRRAVRFIRANAYLWDVDPERLGVTGASAGGHLTLMLAATGDDGDPDSNDDVLRESSRIAAGVALCPPSDLRGWTTDPPEAIARIPTLEPPLDFDAALESDVSPVLHATRAMAPVLMIHGDEDELVPIAHSRNMLAAIEEADAVGDLLVVEGAGHSFNAEQNRGTVVPALVAWFEEHLLAERPVETP